AGIEAGDVILKVDGREVQSSMDVSGYVADLKPGATARIEVWRKGAPRELTVTVGEMKPQTLASATAGPENQGKLGVAVRALTPGEQKEVGTASGLVDDVGR